MKTQKLNVAKSIKENEVFELNGNFCYIEKKLIKSYCVSRGDYTYEKYSLKTLFKKSKIEKLKELNYGEKEE